MILYADIMLAINFSMDFLALFISSLLLHLKLLRLRIVVASLIGSVYALVQVLMEFDAISTAISSIFVAMIMIIVAFRFKGVGQMCLNCIVYLFVNTTLGGIMSLLYSQLNKILSGFIESYSYENTYSIARVFVVISLTAIAAIIFSKILCAKKDVSTVEIKLKIKDVSYTLTGLCDSGNLLKEPFSGKSVILISEDSTPGKEIMSMSEMVKKYIPYQDVNGSGILKGVVPRELSIGTKNVNAIVAIAQNDSFNGYEALVPSGII